MRTLGEGQPPSWRLAPQGLTRGAAHGAAAGVLVRDRENHLLDADAAALDIIGLTREQLQAVASPAGVNLTTLHEDGSPGTDRDLAALLGLATPTVQDARVLGLVRAGAVHWIVITPRQLSVKAAGVELVITSLVDVSLPSPGRHPLSVLYRTPVRSLDQALRRGASGSVLVTICMHCKDIRNDNGLWEPLEEYFTTRSSLLFSHGICPACDPLPLTSHEPSHPPR